MANNRRITIDIEANDYASSVFRNVTANIGGFGSRVGGYMNTANDALRRYNTAMMGFNRTVQRALLEAGRAIYSFTSDAIKQFAKLEEQHAKTMGAMSSNYDFSNPAEVARFQANSQALMNQAIQYGYNGPTGSGSLYSPYEISAAQTALKKAGISEEDILNTDALNNVIKFAGGAGIDLDKAVEFAVQLGAQFDYTPDRWGEMLDQVVYAANASIIDVEDIMGSMKYAGNMAAGYDVPLADVLAALDVMGQSGLKGSQAGTGIQAIFARGMSPTGVTTAGKPPTEHVEEIYNGFASKVVDASGNFKGIGNFTDVLEDATFDLSDQEKAWFYKKLFGMFQQKAGLALTGADPDKGEMTYQDYVDAIIEHAAGTNDKIYEVALETTYGSLESVENAWLAFKTEFGKDLSPVTKSVARQLRNAMVNKDYNFNTDDIRTAVEEAGQLVAQDFGQTLADAVVNAGNFLANAIDVGSADAPMITSAFDALVKLLNGDVTGAFTTLKDGVSKTNENIDDLPPELQETAKAIRNLILIFEGLFALNVVTRIGQAVTGVIGFFSKLSGHNTNLNSNITSTNTNITATSVGSMYVSGNIMTMNVNSIPALTVNSVANATIASMMANTTTMTVYATVVNVIGGSGLGNGGNGTPQLPSGGGTPQLPSGGGLPSLPSGGGFPSLPSGGGFTPIIPILPGGTGTGTLPALPGGTGTIPALPGAAGGAAATGEVINMYYNPITGSYMTGGALAKSFAVTGLKLAGIAGMAYVGASIPVENQLNTAYQYGFGTDYANYLGEDYKSLGGSFGDVMKDIFVNGGKWYDDMRNPRVAHFMEDEVAPATPNSYRNALNDFFDTVPGFNSYDVGRQYIQGMMDRWYYDNSNGDRKFITEDQYVALGASLVQAMSQYMEANGITQVSTNPLGGPDAGGVPGMGTDIYQQILDQMLAGLQKQDDETAAATAQATQENTVAVISLHDAIAALIQNGTLDVMKFGPLTMEGVIQKYMEIFTNPNAAAANQDIVAAITNGIAGLDQVINIDVANPAPRVNVDVKVNVAPSGAVTKNIITSYTGFNDWIFRDAARFGSRTATDR